MDWELLAGNLPHLTAALNTIAAVLLLVALWHIRGGRVRAHRAAIYAALGASTLFLLMYVLHKVALYQTTGEPNTHFPSDAPPAARYTYFSILITHLILAMTVPFLALGALYLAIRRRFSAHRRLVRYAFPIWMYVSVTGVLVYLMLYQMYPA